ncbi:MAG: cytochrome c3 family protein [Gemmatimonadales bacterium]
MLSLRQVLVLVVVGLIVTACTEERIVYRDRAPFNPPADAATGFLGYYTVADRQTTCGNCHVGVQLQWQTTRHAQAWSTLRNSGSAQAFCQGCHTVSERGNPIATAAGYNAVPDSAYHDVQCESCHGPGLTHVQDPGASQPVASLAVSTTAANGTCAECHSGAHHPFADEWEASAHATRVASATRTECITCHTAQGVLAAWGVDTRYTEQSDPVEQQLGIVCAVCHDPHGSGNSAQLRFPIDVPSAENNLCIKCHHKRAEPEVASATIRGPHSPEGPLLLGEGAGWFPPGFQLDSALGRIAGTHGSEANPRLCATCHVSSFSVTDPATGDFRFSATGHLFTAIPCVDSTGIPTNNDCALTQRSFQACTNAGCHGSLTAARSAYITANARIASLVDEIDALLLLVPPGENVRNDGRFTVADGTWFNARLGELTGSAIHNPFLIEYLLLASVDALETTYSLAPMPSGISRDRMFR